MRMRRKNGGSVLLTALVLLSVLGAASAVVWAQLHRGVEAGYAAHRQEAARCLAEAGLIHATAQLQQDPAFTSVADVPLGAGYYSVQVAPGAGAGAYHITSRGELRDGTLVVRQVQLSASLQLRPGGTTAQPGAEAPEP